MRVGSFERPEISDVTGETRGNCCEIWDVKVGCG